MPDIRRSQVNTGSVLLPSLPTFSASAYSNNYRENSIVSRTFIIDWGNAPVSERILTATESSSYIDSVAVSSNQVTVTLDLANVDGNQTAAVNLSAANSAGSDTATWTVHIVEAGAMWSAQTYDYEYLESDGIKTIALGSLLSGTPTPTVAFVGAAPGGVSLSGTTLSVDTAVYDGGSFEIRATNENGSDDADFSVDITNEEFVNPSSTPITSGFAYYDGGFYSVDGNTLRVYNSEGVQTATETIDIGTGGTVVDIAIVDGTIYIGLTYPQNQNPGVVNPRPRVYRIELDGTAVDNYELTEHLSDNDFSINGFSAGLAGSNEEPNAVYGYHFNGLVIHFTSGSAASYTVGTGDSSGYIGLVFTDANQIAVLREFSSNRFSLAIYDYDQNAETLESNRAIFSDWSPDDTSEDVIGMTYFDSRVYIATTVKVYSFGV